MAHVGSSELHTYSNFVAFSQKLLDLACLDFNIMVICTWTHTNLFECDGLLVLTSLIFFLRLLVFKPTIVHQSTHWRDGIGCHLNQIQVSLSGNIKSLYGRHHSHHLTILIDQAYFACADALIHPCLTLTVIPPKILVNRPNLLFLKTSEHAVFLRLKHLFPFAGHGTQACLHCCRDHCESLSNGLYKYTTSVDRLQVCLLQNSTNSSFQNYKNKRKRILQSRRNLVHC